jgi:hypothetical protein
MQSGLFLIPTRGDRPSALFVLVLLWLLMLVTTLSLSGVIPNDRMRRHPQ